MTTNRPYRNAMHEDDVRAEMRRHAGTQFCPSATAALLDVLAARDGAGPDAPLSADPRLSTAAGAS